ncbi:porin family protein [Phenylobacterium sp.]|uniref:porin family protein n=1 Tax=Phenylobacterium sp. TaxID=1871053 RepID=UPI003563B793
MKALITAASALALAALLPAAASAQTAATSGTTFYGTLGYADTDLDHVNLGAIQGRLGARFGQYFGVEGELSGGVKDDKVNVGGTDVKVKLDHQEAIYGVGFLPISPNFDLLARVGYGHSQGSGSVPGVTATAKGDSWNYGVGGQYTFDGQNGVRVDYTREAFQHNNGDANVWSVAYVRKF